MGLKLTVHAVQLISLLVVGEAAADNKELARSLFQLGIDEYAAKQFDAAVASMRKSYDLDPQPQALYALAQAERMAGDCTAALVTYEKLLTVAKDDTTVDAVRKNIELCRQIEEGKAPAVDPAADPELTKRQDAPVLQIRTVYRTERTSDVLGVVMYAGGGVALTGSIALYLVARSTRSDADRATSLADYNDLYDRSATLRVWSYVAAGVGIGALGFAAVRSIRGTSSSEKREIAVSPTAGGSMITFSSRW